MSAVGVKVFIQDWVCPAMDLSTLPSVLQFSSHIGWRVWMCRDTVCCALYTVCCALCSFYEPVLFCTLYFVVCTVSCLPYCTLYCTLSVHKVCDTLVMCIHLLVGHQRSLTHCSPAPPTLAHIPQPCSLGTKFGFPRGLVATPLYAEYFMHCQTLGWPVATLGQFVGRCLFFYVHM